MLEAEDPFIQNLITVFPASLFGAKMTRDNVEKNFVNSLGVGFINVYELNTW